VQSFASHHLFPGFESLKLQPFFLRLIHPVMISQHICLCLRGLFLFSMNSRLLFPGNISCVGSQPKTLQANLLASCQPGVCDRNQPRFLFLRTTKDTRARLPCLVIVDLYFLLTYVSGPFTRPGTLAGLSNYGFPRILRFFFCSCVLYWLRKTMPRL
jgi:hypothetical protein